MEARVLPPPSPPEQTVILELTPTEFAVLYAVHYRHTDGSNPLRTRIDHGMDDALQKLAPTYQKVINENKSGRGRIEPVTNQIQRAFDQLVF